MNKKAIGSVGLILFSAIVLFAQSSCTQDDANARPNFIFKDPPNTESVAKIGDSVISLEDLIGDKKLEYLEIKKREHEFKMTRLNDIIRQRLLTKEAEKKKLSYQEFVDKQIVKGKCKIGKKEFDKFVKEKRIPPQQLTPQIKERVNTFLCEQKKDKKINTYLAKLTKKNPIEVYFKKPKLNIQVDVGDAPVWGKDSAPVTIVEFSDFQCPFCSKAAKTVDEVKKKYKGRVKIAFKHFPLSFHKEARPAAEASMCMHDQSKSKFWKFHDIVFDNQRDLTPADLEKYAKQAGGDMGKFKECMQSGKFRGYVSKDISYGEKIGVRSTPTFFINGELLSGALPFDKFAEAIEDAIAETKVN